MKALTAIVRRVPGIPCPLCLVFSRGLHLHARAPASLRRLCKHPEARATLPALFLKVNQFLSKTAKNFSNYRKFRFGMFQARC